MRLACRCLSPRTGAMVADARRLWRGSAAAVLGAWLLCAGAAHAQGARALTPASPIDSIVAATGRAGFRFVGRVRNLGAVTTATFPVSYRSARVDVDTVLAAPRSVRPLRGRQVTLILHDTLGIVVDTPYVFLASAVQFDSSTVLREEGRFRLDGPGVLPAVRALFTRADSMISSTVIRTRGSTAAAVMAGRVTGVASLPASGEAPPRYRAEHQPAWRVATVRVGTQITPAAALLPGTIRVLFAGSHDALLSAAPRLTDGDSVVLLLRALGDLPPRLRPVGIDTTALFVIWHPLDRQAPARQALVTAAVR